MGKLFWLLLVLTSSAHAATRVAITVDDLPRHGAVPSAASRLELTRKMLEAFKAESVPEVYGFINADKLNGDPALKAVLELWTSYGHPLGNHTYSHLSVNETEPAKFQEQITLNEKALKTYGKKFDWKVFRYPYLREGNTLEKRNAARTYLKEKGYQIAQVTIDFEDWAWNAPYARCADKKDQKQVEWLKETYLKNAIDQLHRAEKLSQALFKRPIAHILLLHIGAMDSEMILPLIKTYKKAGVEFIPLSEAMKDKVYETDPGFVGERGSEFTYQVMLSKGLKLKDVGLEHYADFPGAKFDPICR